jgi:hypothetical protein
MDGFAPSGRSASMACDGRRKPGAHEPLLDVVLDESILNDEIRHLGRLGETTDTRQLELAR